MFKRFSTNYMVLLFILDFFLIQVALWAALILRYVLPYGNAIRPVLAFSFRPALHLAVAIIWVVSFLVVEVYTPRKVIRWFDEWQHILLSHTLAAPALAGTLYLTRPELQLPRLTFVYFYIFVLIILVSYRVVLRYWHRLRDHHSQYAARMLIVGAGKVGQKIVQNLRERPWLGITLVGFLDDDPRKLGMYILGLPVLGTLDEAKTVVANYMADEVLIALPPQAHTRLMNLVARLWDEPIRVRVAPDYLDLIFYGATIQDLGGLPLIGLRDPAITEFQHFVKRLMDIVLSGVGLFFLVPVMLAIGIAILLEDGRPIFYEAERVGENGTLFKMLKFRSMLVNADKLQPVVTQTDEQGHIIHKIPYDPRVTRVGRFIRRTSLDELPQLFNVLKGDMTLVGPRPELPSLVDKYEPWQRKRFAVPQGITGWWQINGRSDKPMHLNTEHDLHYIQNYSFWLDLRIMWKTVAAVVRGKGAY